MAFWLEVLVFVVLVLVLHACPGLLMSLCCARSSPLWAFRGSLFQDADRAFIFHSIELTWRLARHLRVPSSSLCQVCALCLHPDGGV